MRHRRVARADRSLMQQELLHRADTAARQAGELAVDWFWLTVVMTMQRAERLSDAAERAALAAHRMA